MSTVVAIGMPERVGRHHQPAANPARLDEQRGQHRPPLVLGQRDVVLVQEVIVEPSRVETEAVGLQPRLAHLAVRAAHLGDLDPEAKWSRRTHARLTPRIVARDRVGARWAILSRRKESWSRSGPRAPAERVPSGEGR
jgi:hypothetical protein